MYVDMLIVTDCASTGWGSTGLFLALRLVGPPEVHLPLRPLGAGHPRVKMSLAISGCIP